MTVFESGDAYFCGLAKKTSPDAFLLLPEADVLNLHDAEAIVIFGVDLRWFVLIVTVS